MATTFWETEPKRYHEKYHHFSGLPHSTISQSALRGVVSGQGSQAKFQRSFTLRIARSMGTSLPLCAANRGICQFAPPSSGSRSVAAIGRGTTRGTGRPRLTKRATSSRISSEVCSSRAMLSSSHKNSTQSLTDQPSNVGELELNPCPGGSSRGSV
jgi:hypothetical protein